MVPEICGTVARLATVSSAPTEVMLPSVFKTFTQWEPSSAKGVIDGVRSMAKPRRDGCPSRMRFGGSILRWPPLCALLMLGACHAPDEGSGSAEISASTKALRYSDIATVSATISGPEISKPLVVPLGAREDNVWKASVTGIPAGPDRVVSVVARDLSGVGLFFGEATGVTIRIGATTPIALDLFEMSPAPDFANHAPEIDALTASAAVASPQGTVSLGAQAHDSDSADVLGYVWSASCGELTGADIATPVWTAPDGAGACQIEVTVSDGRGASVSSGLTLVVDATSRGGAAVSLSADLSPVIKRISVVPTPLVVGQPVMVNLDAEDPDGQALTYQWTSDCAGTFVDDKQQNASFALSSLPEGGTCRFQVDVADADGAHTIGVLNQKTGTTPVDRAPVIESATESQGELAPGQAALVIVKASDPDGQELAFSWMADVGTVTELGGSAPHEVSLRFTAPATLPEGAMHLVVTVKDSGAQSAKVTFIFNRPNHAPTMTGPTISSVPLLLGAMAQLNVTAVDGDGDLLTFTWTSSCDGTFDDVTSARPVFTLKTFPEGYYCSFAVTVTDGHGGEAIGTVVGTADHLPVVATPSVSETEILVGTPVTLGVTATDPDEGDALSYSWSRSCEGAFDDKSKQNPTFILTAAPSTGHCSFTVTVTDLRGGQSMASVERPVDRVPDITDMQVVPLPLLAGQPTQLSVVGTDADGDPLTYAWKTDCDGSFAGEASPTPTFTLAVVPATRLCTFQVQVSDGRGGSSVGQISGQAGAVGVNVAPSIVATSQSATSVLGGDVVVLGVSAADPEGQPVTYRWSASDGTLDTPVTEPDTSRSRVDWTVPAVMPSQTMYVTVVVSDPSGLSSAFTFEFAASP